MGCVGVSEWVITCVCVYVRARVSSNPEGMIQASEFLFWEQRVKEWAEGG